MLALERGPRIRAGGYLYIYAIAEGGVSDRGLSKRDTNLKECRREIQESVRRTQISSYSGQRAGGDRFVSLIRSGGGNSRDTNCFEIMRRAVRTRSRI
jgi:hypothetical protein